MVLKKAKYLDLIYVTMVIRNSKPVARCEPGFPEAQNRWFFDLGALLCQKPKIKEPEGFTSS
jgi:hypothetical protein